MLKIDFLTKDSSTRQLQIPTVSARAGGKLFQSDLASGEASPRPRRDLTRGTAIPPALCLSAFFSRRSWRPLGSADSTPGGRSIHHKGLTRPWRPQVAEEQRRQAIPGLELAHHSYRKPAVAVTTAGGEAIDLLEDREHLAADQRGKDQVTHQLLERAGGDRAAAEHRTNCKAAVPKAPGGDTHSPAAPINLPTKDLVALALLALVCLFAHLEPGSPKRQHHTRHLRSDLRGRSAQSHKVVYVLEMAASSERTRTALITKPAFCRPQVAIDDPLVNVLAPPQSPGPPHRHSRQPRVDPLRGLDRAAAKLRNAHRSGAQRAQGKEAAQSDWQLEVVEGILQVRACEVELFAFGDLQRSQCLTGGETNRPRGAEVAIAPATIGHHPQAPILLGHEKHVNPHTIVETEIDEAKMKKVSNEFFIVTPRPKSRVSKRPDHSTGSYPLRGHTLRENLTCTKAIDTIFATGAPQLRERHRLRQTLWQRKP